MIQLELEKPLGKALTEGNDYFLIEVNKAA